MFVGTERARVRADMMILLGRVIGPRVRGSKSAATSAGGVGEDML